MFIRWRGLISLLSLPYLGLYRDNGQETGKYCSIFWLDRDHGQENGNYNRTLGLYRDNGQENGNYWNRI